MVPAPLWDEDADFFAEDPPADALVAELDGAVVGYVRLRRPTDLPSHRHVRQLNGLAGDPAAQRRGVGRALLLAVIEEARRRGAHRLILRVLGTNSGAPALYTGCGFEVEGVARRVPPRRAVRRRRPHGRAPGRVGGPSVVEGVPPVRRHLAPLPLALVRRSQGGTPIPPAGPARGTSPGAGRETAQP